MKIGYLMQEGGPDVRQKPLSGPANHVWQVFKNLQALGHEVRLVANYDKQICVSDDLETFQPVTVKGADQGRFRTVERFIRGFQSRLSLPYLNLFDSLRYAMACQQELAGFDIFYERLGWMGYGAGLAAKRVGVPLIIEANNGDFITELEMLGVAPQGLQRWIAIELMRRAVYRTQHVVATGQGHRNRFIEWWRVDPSDVTVVENGSEVVDLLPRSDLLAFQPPPDSHSTVRVVYLGAFEPWHGINILIPAIAAAISANPSIQLTLMGTGTLWEPVNRQIDEFGIRAHVQITGQIPIQEVASHLAGADIGVAPYCGWMEFSGLKIFDYKAAGLAIVASGKEGKPATLEHEQTGWIVPPCDEELLSEAILKLASDIALRRRLGQAARLEAEETHSWEHTARRLEAIFETALESPPGFVASRPKA